MNQKYRTLFNDNFSTDKYEAFIDDITSDFDYKVTFRIGETPFFIPDSLKTQLIEASNEVINFIKRDDFLSLTNKASSIKSNNCWYTVLHTSTVRAYVPDVPQNPSHNFSAECSSGALLTYSRRRRRVGTAKVGGSRGNLVPHTFAG